jgi:hypothetical protein
LYPNGFGAGEGQEKLFAKVNYGKNDPFPIPLGLAANLIVVS